LMGMKIEVIPEDVTNKGRIDLTVKFPDKTIIMEFKMEQLGESSIHQIREKRYYEKYQNENNPIYLMGIVFSETERNIVDYQIEKWN
jgi:hypothetical protein